MVFCRRPIGCNKLVIIGLGPWIGNRGCPEGRGKDILRGISSIALEFRKGETGSAPHKKLCVQIQFLGLPHEQGGIHHIGNHVNKIRLLGLDRDKERLEIHSTGLVALLHHYL